MKEAKTIDDIERELCEKLAAQIPKSSRQSFLGQSAVDANMKGTALQEALELIQMRGRRWDRFSEDASSEARSAVFKEHFPGVENAMLPMQDAGKMQAALTAAKVMAVENSQGKRLPAAQELIQSVIDSTKKGKNKKALEGIHREIGGVISLRIQAKNTRSPKPKL